MITHFSLSLSYLLYLAVAVWRPIPNSSLKGSESYKHWLLFRGATHPQVASMGRFTRTLHYPLTSYKPASVKASVCQATFISPRLRCGRTCSYSFNPPVRFHVRSAESTGRLHRPNGVLSCSPCGEHLAPYVDVCRAAPALL